MDLCPYCQLLDTNTCENYPNKGWCSVGWKPEPEVNETANDNAASLSHPIQALGRMLLAAGRK